MSQKEIDEASAGADKAPAPTTAKASSSPAGLALTPSRARTVCVREGLWGSVRGVGVAVLGVLLGAW